MLCVHEVNILKLCCFLDLITSYKSVALLTESQLLSGVGGSGYPKTNLPCPGQDRGTPSTNNAPLAVSKEKFQKKFLVFNCDGLSR